MSLSLQGKEKTLLVHELFDRRLDFGGVLGRMDTFTDDDAELGEAFRLCSL